MRQLVVSARRLMTGDVQIGGDLPLGGDAAARYLPWAIGVMVFLATVILAANMVVARVGADWRAGLNAAVTVQIVPAPQPAAGRPAKGAGADTAARVARALGVIRATPGVASAEAISQSETLALIAPWVGDAATAAELPLPVLIDVRLASDAGSGEGGFDADALARRLAAEVPGAVVDDHRGWMRRLIALSVASEAAAAALLVLIASAAAATIVFAVQAGVAIHREAIGLLHLIGARDGYIARQFEAHAAWLALKGGAVGAAFAALALAGIFAAYDAWAASIAPRIGLTAVQWAALGVLPLGAAAIALGTARLAVLRALARMV